MQNQVLYYCFAILLITSSCEDPSLEWGETFDEGISLLGKWQVYEKGYSPGSGYIIVEVPAEPAQLLNFKSGNRFSSNILGFESFTYYLILNDKSESSILALYEEKPDNPENEDTKNLDHSYTIGHEKGRLKLRFRFCTEGCHIGLKRIE